MERKIFRLRSPTGRAWLGTATGMILAGEVFWDLHKETPATFFNIPFTDGELWFWVIGLLLVGLVSLGWLLALYLAPGELTVDEERGTLTRRRRPLWRLELRTAPMSEWRVRLRYFDEEQERRGVFKRLALATAGFDEVLLFSDLRNGEALAQALTAQRDRLGAWEVELDRTRQPPQVPAR